MKTISAEIIADSLAPNGSRCTTFILTMPRIVLAEFNTHRMISKNSASSRAIPFEKMREAALSDPFIPMKWMKNHKGMQGEFYVEDQKEIESLEKDWLYGRDKAVRAANDLYEKGLTKQICNRLLEPFMWHTVIATATEWENFFALRAHPQAEIHIQKLAHVMLEAYNESTPKRLMHGEWHIPFSDKMDEERIINDLLGDSNGWGKMTDEKKASTIAQFVPIGKLKIATARCARISYNNFEGTDNYSKDFALTDSLASSGHWSPFEHCAQAHNMMIESGNLHGFIQYRKVFMGENQHDQRVKTWTKHGESCKGDL